MTHINHSNVEQLTSAGYEIFETYIPDEGRSPGLIVVADPVLCISGSHKWAEVRKVYLRTSEAVTRFIDERS